MRIQQIDPAVHADRTRASTQLRRPRRAGQIETRTAVPEEPAQPTAPERPVGSGEARGVIRLFEAGHFRGVADVRLRINFFDELQSRVSAARATALEEGADNVVGTVQSGVDELLTVAEPDAAARERIDAAVEEFESETRALLAGQAVETPSSADSLRDATTSIFDAFVAELSELLIADTAEPDARDTGESAPAETGDDTAAPAEEGAETAGTLEEAFADLRATFEEAVADLIASLESVSQLPEPSPPNGNGRAYERFLAIYNGLRESPDPQIDEES